MKTKITADCAQCGVVHSVPATEHELENYRRGMLVQDAFPNLSVNQREVVIGHRCGLYLCPNCSWDDYFEEE